MSFFNTLIKISYFSIALIFSLSSQAGMISGDKWGDPTLGTTGGEVTWSLIGDGLSCAGLEPSPCVSSALSSFMPTGFIAEIERAFNLWSSVADITFTMTVDGGEPIGGTPGADIRIGGHTIDGIGNNLAHAYYPEGYNHSGDIHFDDSDSWGINTVGTFDIFSIALHEIGHAIGLQHSTDSSAVLYSQYNGVISGLQADDILTVQSIYGAAPLQASVPEPSSILLFSSLIGLIFVKRKTL